MATMAGTLKIWTQVFTQIGFPRCIADQSGTQGDVDPSGTHPAGENMELVTLFQSVTHASSGRLRPEHQLADPKRSMAVPGTV